MVNLVNGIGRNLYPDSGDMMVYFYPRGVNSNIGMVDDDELGFGGVLKMDIEEQLTFDIFYWSSARAKLEKNETYTLSFYIKSTVEFTIRLRSVNQSTIIGSNSMDVGDKYSLCIMRFTPDVDYPYNANSHFSINDYPSLNLTGATLWVSPIKIEKGTVATPYQQAPEDMMFPLTWGHIQE